MADYSVTGNPISLSRGASALIRVEFGLIQTAIATKSDVGGDTYTGAHDFTGATSVTVPTPTTATQAATKAYVDALSVAAGNVPIGGTTGQVLKKNSATNYDLIWGDVSPTVVRSARTSNTILAEADRGTLIDITSGTFSQTFTAAATLGSGWYCYIRNTGTGVVTLDPNASETIDGVASGTLFGTLLIQCDGTNFNATKVGPNITTELLTSGTSWTAPIGVRFANVRGVGGGGSGGKSANTTAAGSGSGGGYFEVVVRTTPGTAYTYAIGAAGASQTSNAAGNNGGNTTWNDGVTTYTGSGGVGGKILGTSGPSAGGTGTNGTVNISGGSGQVVDASTVATLGGGTPLGLGGVGTLGAVNGLAPTGYGSGSGGASSSQNSFAGMQGCIILEY